MTDDQYDLNIHHHKDRNVVEINIAPHQGAPTCHIDLAPEHLDAVIEHLGKIRAAMTPAIGGERPPTGPTTAILDPVWWVQPEPLTEGMAIGIRHPGFGWQSFVIPEKSLKTLKGLVDTNVARIDATPKPRAN